MNLGPHFWESICLAIFVAVVYKPIKKILTAQLDEHSDRIRQIVTEAENLRADAEKLFNYYTERHQYFEEQMAILEKHANDHINLIKQDAAETLAAKIKIRRLMHEEKLALYTKEEKNKVREIIIHKAMTLANIYIQDAATPGVTKQNVTELLNVMRDKPVTFH